MRRPLRIAIVSAAFALLLFPHLRAAGQLATAPTQLRLSWSDDPRTTMSVVWQTAASVDAAVVEFGDTPKLGRTAAARRVTYPQETGVLYEATMRGLRAGGTYFYRVGDARGGFSEVSQFRTAPAGVMDFVFTAFGDHGVGEASRRNIEHLVREKPAFHLLLGDLSYANGNQPVWDRWFAQNEPFTRTTPLMPALGNHENERIAGERIGYVSYLARLALPAPETWYTFDYAGVRFISFNSDDFRNPEQLAWLERTLAAAKQDPAVRWRVLFMHHPLYSTNVRRLDNKPLIETLRGRIDEGAPDLVFAGHNHNYERYYPLKPAGIGSRDPGRYKKGDGPIFLIAGGGGKSLYEFVPEKPETLVFREATEHYLRVRVPARGPLSVEAVRTRDLSVMDRFEIAPR